MIKPLHWIACLTGLGAMAVLVSCGTPNRGTGGPSGAPVYKVGAPYQIDGTWYYPAEDYTYDQTGIASWYGPKFDGRRTANGEIFDMTKMTAAHRTLPLPSVVQVTNLENGRQIVVRVNDRGPFARGRIIDLSRKSARRLGFARRGTAKVRVRILAEESLTLNFDARRGAAAEPRQTTITAVPRQAVTEIGISPPKKFRLPKQVAARSDVASAAAAFEAAPVTVVPVRPSSIFVQAGAFADAGNAKRLRDRLASVGPTRIDKVVVAKRKFYRVRMGPVATVADGDKLLSAVVGAGIAGAHLIVD
jgi:rare lipoprotein A